MKKTLIAGVAALLMATSAAHGFYPKELPDNAPGWFSRRDWLPPKPPNLKKILEEHELCKASEATKKVSNSDFDFSWLPCLVISLQLFPLWISHIEEPAKVAVEWPLPPPPILVQWPELPPTVVRDDIGGMIMEYTAHWQDQICKPKTVAQEPNGPNCNAFRFDAVPLGLCAAANDMVCREYAAPPISEA
jgi:hypothetical protein